MKRHSGKVKRLMRKPGSAHQMRRYGMRRSNKRRM